MYSRGYSERPKSYIADSENESVSLPPRYSGVRFVKEKRSDGREGVFERAYNSVPQNSPLENEERLDDVICEEDASADTEHNGHGDTECIECEMYDECDSEESVKGEEVFNAKYPREKNLISNLLSSIGEDDFLIIALILLLAGQHEDKNKDMILLLAILLCFR